MMLQELILSPELEINLSAVAAYTTDGPMDHHAPLIILPDGPHDVN